jgi:CRP-like cAMP-binding protein
MPYMQPFLEKLLKRTHLTDVEQAAILSLRGIREEFYSQRDFLGREERRDSMCVISRGICARTSVNAQGDRQITAFCMTGDIPDLHRLMLPKSASTFMALSPGEIVRIKEADIREVALQYPGIAEAMWRDTVCDGSISAEWIVNIGRRDAKTRIAHLVCEMAVRLGSATSNAFSYEFPITQVNLADATGLSTVHTNRSLQSLRREGLVRLQGGTIWVEDWETLKTVGEFSQEYLCFDDPTRLTTIH